MTNILIVGEFMTGTDSEAGGPFEGKLNSMTKSFLRQAGIEPRHCEFTNVFNKTSPTSRAFGFYGPKPQGVPHLKPLKSGKYLLKEHMPDLELLWKKVQHFQPNLVIALGDVALWALTSDSSLKFARGRITTGHSKFPEQKILPTYTAGQIMAEWPLRPIHLADLEKAKRESEFPEVRRPQRFIHVEPTIEEIKDFFDTYMPDCVDLDCDIETKGTMITCVGFGTSPSRALVIPFYDETKPSGNYWPSKFQELQAWGQVRRFLSAGKNVGGQNFQYDMQYLWRQMGIKSPDFADDTMLMHHALQPEMQKGLGFLASIYTDELPWKFMSKVKANDKTARKGATE